MPSFSFVPNCNQKGYSTSSAEKVSFFNFPKETLIRKQWIPRDSSRRRQGLRDNRAYESLFTTFQSEDLRKTINGRIYIKEGGVPSKFDWSGPSPKKRKAPTERHPLPEKKKLLTEDNSASVNNEVQETIEMSASEPSTSLEEDTCKTPDLERQIDEQSTKIGELEEELREAESEISNLRRENTELNEKLAECERQQKETSSRLF